MTPVVNMGPSALPQGPTRGPAGGPAEGGLPTIINQQHLTYIVYFKTLRGNYTSFDVG